MMKSITALTGLAYHLTKEGVLPHLSIEHAWQAAKRQRISFVHHVVKHKMLSSQAIAQFCATHFGLPVKTMPKAPDKIAAHSLLSDELVRRYDIIPFTVTQGVLELGMADPTDQEAIHTATFYTGLRIHPVIVLWDEIQNYIHTHYPNTLKQKMDNTLVDEPDAEIVIQHPAEMDDAPVIKFVNHLIQHAVQLSASDIHIEPYENHYRIRYRQSGILHETNEIPKGFAHRLMTRLKVLAKLDIAERRLPQDGRFHEQGLDFRVSTCPLFQGEKIVLRLQSLHPLSFDIDKLGLTMTQKTLFLQALAKPEGLILVTGPTGSGKTVTLYSALNELNTVEKNIATVEDPVEIKLSGINQVNIQPKIGLDFATVLRSLLRQDPDILMVGEIRDLETAEIAFLAAQTGHLVLSTLHAQSTVETLTRLSSMGIPLYAISSTISLIIAQRLIRVLCAHCKQEERMPTIDLPNEIIIYKAVGCEHCQQGYRNRIGIYEFLPFTDSLTQLIMARGTNAEITRMAKEQGFQSLQEQGYRALTNGITSFNELTRVLR